MSVAQTSEGSQLLEKVTAAYAVESVKRKISEQWVRDLSFYGTQITEDEMLQIIMKYKMPLPFSLFGQDSVDVETVCSRRLWTGADGERGKKKAETGEQDERMGLYRKVLYPVSFAKHLPLSFSQPDPDPFR